MSILNLFRTDGWFNVLAGLSRKADKTNKSEFRDYVYLTDQELTNLYIGEGFGKRIVSSPADDMTRAGFSIAGDEEGKIQEELNRLNFNSILNSATKWARLYRGNITLLGIDDGRLLTEPVNMKAIRGINWLKNFPAPNIDVSQTDIVQNPASPYFEDVEIYKLQKLDGTQILAHSSRCLILKGDPVPPTNVSTLDFQYRYWGMSILQPIWERLRNFGSIEQGMANLALEAVVGKMKVKGLADILASNNSAAVYNRMEVINATKSLINAVLLDSDGEDYIRDSVSFAGIPDMIDRFMMMLSGVSGIPVTRLFGRSPAGMNATGESDLRTYYDGIASMQETWLRPPVQTIVNLINAYKTASDDPKVEFLPVWEMTEKEQTDIRSTQSQTDERYINSGVLTSEEVRTARFVGQYSTETVIEDILPQEESEEGEGVEVPPGTENTPEGQETAPEAGENEEG